MQLSQDPGRGQSSGISLIDTLEAVIENIKSISKLKKRIVEDGYLVIENSSDKQGNVRFKESEKLKGVFGKDLKTTQLLTSS